MDSKELKKHQVIGACVQMQTISWEDEMKLMDGIPFHIDFFQDFSNVFLDGYAITSIPTSTLLEAIISPDEETEQCTKRTFDWKYVNKQLKKEWKAQKWEKKHSKSKNYKQAVKNFNRIYDEMMEK